VIDPRINTTVHGFHGTYLLKDCIGKGGMGVVYIAHRVVPHHKRRRRGRQAPSLVRADGKEFAVKMPLEALQSPLGLQRALRELETLKTLNHPNIVPLEDHGPKNGEGLPFLVFPNLTGGTLEDRLSDPVDFASFKIKLAQHMKHLSGLADAVDFMHHAGRIHRDIKPANIMFDERDNIVITDMGLVGLLESGAFSRITAPGTALGSPFFMAPEMREGKLAMAASDQFMLALVALHMITHAPLDTRLLTPAKLGASLKKHLITFAPWVPDDLLPVFEKALSFNPQNRHQSCSELVRALQDTLRTADPAVVQRKCACNQHVRLSTQHLEAVVQCGACRRKMRFLKSGSVELLPDWLNEGDAIQVEPAHVAPLLPPAITWKNSPPVNRNLKEKSKKSKRKAIALIGAAGVLVCLIAMLLGSVSYSSIAQVDAPAPVVVHPNHTARITFSVPRRTDKGVTHVRVSNLPAGVVAPDVFLPGGVETASVDLKAAATAWPGDRDAVVEVIDGGTARVIHEVHVTVALRTRNMAGMTFVEMPASEPFLMPVGEETQQVVVSAPTWILNTPVTLGQWRRYARATGRVTTGERLGALGLDATQGNIVKDRCFSLSNTGWPLSDDHAIVNVSWKEAKAFTESLLRQDLDCRLPTEAEYMHAARAGLTNVDSKFPEPVHTGSPNAFGIYLGGTLREFLQDWDGQEYHRIAPQQDPPGPRDGVNKLIRGWSPFTPASRRNLSNRENANPNDAFPDVSFRIVLIDTMFELLPVPKGHN